MCRITKGLPTLFTPDEPKSRQSPSASAFSHLSNIWVKKQKTKKTPFIQTLPFHLYRTFFIFMHNVKLLFLFILIYSYFGFIFVLFQQIFCHMHLCNVIISVRPARLVYKHHPQNSTFVNYIM